VINPNNQQQVEQIENEENILSKLYVAAQTCNVVQNGIKIHKTCKFVMC